MEGGDWCGWGAVSGGERVPPDAGGTSRVRLSRVLHEVVRNFVLYPMSHRESFVDFF